MKVGSVSLSIQGKSLGVTIRSFPAPWPSPVDSLFSKGFSQWMALLGSLECLDLNLDCFSPEILELKHFPSLSRAFLEAPARSTLESREDQHHSNSRRNFRDFHPNPMILALPFPKIIPGTSLPAGVVSPFSVSIRCRIPWRGKVGFEGDLWILEAFPRMFRHP